jgi:hypothetical protein
LVLPDLGSLRADVEGVVLQFAELLEQPATKTALMAVVAEATHDDALRQRLREKIVARQKRLVVEGRRRAQSRGEIPPDTTDPGPQIDLIFDMIAGAVVHRTLVSCEPVDSGWAARFTAVLLDGLAAAAG